MNGCQRGKEEPSSRPWLQYWIESLDPCVHDSAQYSPRKPEIALCITRGLTGIKICWEHGSAKAWTKNFSVQFFEPIEVIALLLYFKTLRRSRGGGVLRSSLRRSGLKAPTPAPLQIS